MANEIEQVSVSPLVAANDLIQKDNGVDIEKLAAVLELQSKWEAGQAKKAYVKAMAEFKEDPPVIIKDKHVSFGQTSYNHATLSNVTASINKALSKHGLAASWETGQDNSLIKVTCKITHVQGHSESTSLSAPADTSGSKNAIQAIGSAVTYLQRYTILALTGLATNEQDDDGLRADEKPKPKPMPKPTDDEAERLGNIYKLFGRHMTKSDFCKFVWETSERWPQGIEDEDTLIAAVEESFQVQAER